MARGRDFGDPYILAYRCGHYGDRPIRLATQSRQHGLPPVYIGHRRPAARSRYTRPGQRPGFMARTVAALLMSGTVGIVIYVFTRLVMAGTGMDR